MNFVKYTLINLAVLLAFVSAGLHDNKIDEENLDTCHRILDHIPKHFVNASLPPDVMGVWTSKRCEVRPGPEFILRKYIFPTNRTFEAHQYIYSDKDCVKPMYGIVAKGSLHMRGPSWIVPGGTEVDYELNKVIIVPYYTEIARELQMKLNRTCPDLAALSWKPYKTYDLFNYIELKRKKHSKKRNNGNLVILDQDCTQSMGFNMHELQLIRVEVRGHGKHRRRELHLGDINTNREDRMEHSPTCYQEPLMGPKTSGCAVCRIILNSDESLPPELKKRHDHVPPLDLPGQWVSHRCEIRPNGMFLTRRLIFENIHRTWQGYYHYFNDPLCSQKSFSFFAWGTFYAGPSSKKIKGAYNYDFKTVSIKITPEDIQIVNSLNSDRSGKCGRAGRWMQGIQHDVTETGGCDSLGLKVPHIEYDLLRMEKTHNRDWLYLGQRPSRGRGPIHQRIRPTSFQVPLVKCGPLKTQMEPYRLRRNYNAAKYWRLNSNSNICSSSNVTLLVFMTIHFFIMFR